MESQHQASSKNKNAGIALRSIPAYNAANVPARYVHGNVEIPVAQFMNMVGDFADIDAARDFASAGGIPITGILTNGQLTRLRIEHVWVEAALPYYPSQGARPVSATNPIDTWVPIDPSFKQYDYLQGLDTAAIVDIDGEQLANNFINSGTVNEQEGWVQGLSASIIEQAQQQAQQKLEAHIESMQNPTVGDVIGGRTIIAQSFNVLPSSLPYQRTAKGNTFAQLPANLQVRVNLGLGWDRFDQDYLQKRTMPLYQLNQRNITISFKPASVADENALRALIPDNLTDPSQLPNFLPSSIRVIPEIKRDDEVLLTAGALALGAEIDMGYSFTTPTRSYLDKRTSIVAGSYLALGIVGSNPSSKTFYALKANLERTKQILETGTEAQRAALTWERLVGDRYVAGIQGYYTQLITQSRIMGLKARVMYQPMPMAGTFGYEPNPRISFGINRGIELHGVYMDVRTTVAAKDRNGDGEKVKQLMLQAGMLSSALEHQMPEMIYTDPDSATKPEGFSTAKALGLAMAQGQKIYTITQQNQAQVLPNLRLDSLAMTEIRNALAAGKEVITHTDQLTIPGFRGSGFVITDPVTGEGAYKISGGKNGGFLEIISSLPVRGMALLAAALAALDAAFILGGCEDTSKFIALTAIAIFSTLMSSILLGIIFAAVMSGPVGFIAGVALLLFLTLIALALAYFFKWLFESQARSSACRTPRG